jgi:hypothetical protein
VCEAVIGRLGWLPRPERIIHDADREHQGRDGLRLGKPHLRMLRSRSPGSFLHTDGVSGWRPSTRAVMFGLDRSSPRWRTDTDADQVKQPQLMTT